MFMNRINIIKMFTLPKEVYRFNTIPVNVLMVYFTEVEQVFQKFIWCGELFQAWEMRLSPHSEKPVGSEVGGQDPRPWIGSPVGNQACIVPRLLWDLLLLKLPHPELRQQMFTEYLHLPKVCAKPSKYRVWPASPLSCNILLFALISRVLSFVLLKR